MRRRDAYKRISAGLALVLGISLLSGCESKTVDYVDGGTTESVQTVKKGSNKDVEQFKGASRWKDEWKAVDADGYEVTMVVDTDISLPNEEQMYVIEVEETVFDAAYKERVATAFFGEGNVYYHDLAHYTKNELLEQYDFALEDYNNKSKSEEDRNEAKAELEQYEELLQTATDAHTPVETYDVDDYCGERDGNFYALEFREDAWRENAQTYTRYKSVMFRAMLELYPPDTSASEEIEFSEEAARSQVEDLMDRMGWEDFILTESQLFDDNEGGYFRFKKGINQTPFGTYGVEVDSTVFWKKDREEEKRYDLKASCAASVQKWGILWMEIENPIEITEISNAVEMLPLATVQDIMKDKAINEFDKFRFVYDLDQKQITFNHMDLIYFRVRDKENDGRYSYVPAWRLTDKEREDRGYEVISPILINAIDGSVIDFYDEV